MRNSLLLITGLFLYCFVSFSFTKNIVVRAEDLKEEVEEIVEEETSIYDEIDDIESDNSDEQEELHDVIKPIQEDTSEFEEDQYDFENTDNVLPDQSENEEDMNNKEPEFIMIIFSFGLVCGIMLGRLLTGFIK